jgi:hypothetical protein
VDVPTGSGSSATNPQTAQPTWIHAVTLGFRVPMPSGSHRESGTQRGAFLLGVSWSELEDGDRDEEFLNATIAFEVLF